MKKRINIILIVISLILTLLVGCGTVSSNQEDTHRFVWESQGNSVWILHDTETNVDYLFVKVNSYAAGLTVLEKGE